MFPDNVQKKEINKWNRTGMKKTEWTNKKKKVDEIKMSYYVSKRRRNADLKWTEVKMNEDQHRSTTNTTTTKSQMGH